MLAQSLCRSSRPRVSRLPQKFPVHFLGFAGPLGNSSSSLLCSGVVRTRGKRRAVEVSIARASPFFPTQRFTSLQHVERSQAILLCLHRKVLCGLKGFGSSFPLSRLQLTRAETSMADVLSAKLVCPQAKSLQNSGAAPLNRMPNLRRAPESLAFSRFVASRPALPLFRSCCHTRRPCVQVNAATLYPTSMAWWKKGNQPNMQDINSAQDFVDAMTKAGDKLVLVDFYSVSCRSCKALYPKICQIAADNPDLVVLKVNFHENIALCRSLNVSMLPFCHFYRGNEGRIDAFSCSLTKINKLRAAVAKHKNRHLAMPGPGPVAPVPNWKALMPMGTHSLAAAASVA